MMGVILFFIAWFLVGIISAVVYIGICAKDISRETFIEDIHSNSEDVIKTLISIIIYGFISPIVIMIVLGHEFMQDKQMGDKILRWIHKIVNSKNN